MSIAPISDIVMDVAQAADPVRLRAATEKLTKLQSAADVAFGAALDDQAAGAPAPATGAAPGEPAAVPAGTQFKHGKAGDSVYRKFEAFVLQSFVQSMLPKKAEVVFGKGTAGEIWKSMLAEQIGKQIADAGGVGIAKQLAAADRKRSA